MVGSAQLEQSSNTSRAWVTTTYQVLDPIQRVGRDRRVDASCHSPYSDAALSWGLSTSAPTPRGE